MLVLLHFIAILVVSFSVTPVNRLYIHFEVRWKSIPLCRHHRILPSRFFGVREITFIIFRKSIELGPIEQPKEYTCEQHTDEFLTMYCLICNVAICCKCINTTKHNNHNVQSLSTTVKTHKVSHWNVFTIQGKDALRALLQFYLLYCHCVSVSLSRI
jgi:hypothetical protein